MQSQGAEPANPFDQHFGVLAGKRPRCHYHFLVSSVHRSSLISQAAKVALCSRGEDSYERPTDR